MDKEYKVFWYPGEIKMKDGYTCATNAYYLDQLSKEIKYIRLVHFKKYLLENIILIMNNIIGLL